jgi:hypothetical protein
MWYEIALIFFGFICGMITMWYLVKPALGDDYEINRPKVKGRNNILDVVQNNEPKKKRFQFLRKKKK